MYILHFLKLGAIAFNVFHRIPGFRSQTCITASEYICALWRLSPSGWHPDKFVIHDSITDKQCGNIKQSTKKSHVSEPFRRGVKSRGGTGLKQINNK